MKPVKEMSTLTLKYNLLLVMVTFVLVEATPEVSMTYTVDGGDSRPVKSHQNLTTCSGVPVELSVCVPTARPGSLLSLKVKGQTTLSSQTCVRVAEKFSSSQAVVLSYDEEEFVFYVNVDVCVVSRKRRSSTWRSSSYATSWINGGYMPWANSGQHTSRLRDSSPLPLDLSYMTFDNDNWIVFQRRTTGHVDFYRNWAQYVSGFGDVTGELWLGLEHIHTLCPPSRPCRLRVDLKDPDYKNGELVWAEYSNFSVSGYCDNYRLSISGYDSQGTAGDSLYYHDGSAFSTKDKDNDNWSGNCATEFHGGWWYKSCVFCNLNGKYDVRDNTGGLLWNTPKSPEIPDLYATYTEMKVRVLG